MDESYYSFFEDDADLSGEDYGSDDASMDENQREGVDAFIDNTNYTDDGMHHHLVDRHRDHGDFNRPPHPLHQVHRSAPRVDAFTDRPGAHGRQRGLGERPRPSSVCAR